MQSKQKSKSHKNRRSHPNFLFLFSMVFFVIIASSSFSLKEKVSENNSCWHSRHRKPITSELKTNNLKKKNDKTDLRRARGKCHAEEAEVPDAVARKSRAGGPQREGIVMRELTEHHGHLL